MSKPRANRPGFTLVEILLAAMILAIGFMMLLPAFTVGLTESRTSMDASTALQVAQNAEACCQTMLRRNDSNWTAADGSGQNKDGNIHHYEFNLDNGGSAAPSLIDAIGTDASGQVRTSIRVHGDLGRSRFYWNLLYRIDPARPNEVELWILVCKREQTGDLKGLMAPDQNGSIGGSAGSKTISANSHTEAGTSLVASTGEIINCTINNDGEVTVDREVTSGFSGAWSVPAGTGDSDNACVYVAHTKKAF